VVQNFRQLINSRYIVDRVFNQSINQSISDYLIRPKKKVSVLPVAVW